MPLLTLLAVVCLVVAACVLGVDAVLSLTRGRNTPGSPAPVATYRTDARDAAAPSERGRAVAPALGLVAVAACSLGLVPAAPPSPAAPTAASMTFGAGDVRHGATTVLHMDAPITGVEVVPDGGGFRAILRGGRSLDRAGSVAAVSPSLVERASVENRDDHAELEVRFVVGRSPAYRVEAVGDEIRITIGR